MLAASSSQAPESESNGELAFGQYLRRLIYKHGHTIEGFRKQFHIALQNNIRGHAQIPNEKIQRVIDALALKGDDAEDVWQQYMGDHHETMQDVLQAGIKRYGFEGLRLLTNKQVSESTLLYMLHGDPRRNMDVDAPHHPKFETWLIVTRAMGVDDKKAYGVWRESTQEFLMKKKANLFAAEIEMLFREQHALSARALKTGTEPALQHLSTRARAKFIHEQRMGIPYPWTETERLLDVFRVTLRRWLYVADAWLGVVSALPPNQQKALEVPLCKQTMKERREDYLRLHNAPKELKEDLPYKREA